ncbi:hypothetical protein [Clostridium gasigenes]|uniref:hypothetical protein n=1 Tax=Clostridium gasigenes TaxID=94869 RepID=UPI001C0BDC98|nr:hypothetical protein [Clostridium gasigenes]MBU3107153.1 hypothetical protein [Clostridium gasigenes]
MQEIYTILKCKGCHKSTILLNDEVNKTLNSGKFLSCGHCGCKKFNEEKATDDLRDIMKARKYKRNSHGALEQI